jgi:hypothetical protein
MSGKVMNIKEVIDRLDFQIEEMREVRKKLIDDISMLEERVDDCNIQIEKSLELRWRSKVLEASENALMGFRNTLDDVE